MTILQAYSSDGPSLSTLVLVLALVGLFVYVLVYYTKTIDFVAHHDHQSIEELQFSTQEFYSLVDAFVKEKQMPGVITGRVYHSMHGVFSGKREYLRVQYQNYFFDICAAPFAKDFFVSYRQGTLNVVIKSKRGKTFYEIDTENMFFLSVKKCYERALDRMLEKKGIRKASSELPLIQ